MMMIQKSRNREIKNQIVKVREDRAVEKRKVRDRGAREQDRKNAKNPPSDHVAKIGSADPAPDQSQGAALLRLIDQKSAKLQGLTPAH